MFVSLLETIISGIIFIASYIVNIILQPLFAILAAWFPDFTSYLADFEYFFVNYIVKGVAFAREVFLNCSGFPRPLLHAIVLIYLGKLAFHLTIVVVKFILNVYHYVRGSGGEMVE